MEQKVPSATPVLFLIGLNASKNTLTEFLKRRQQPLTIWSSFTEISSNFYLNTTVGLKGQGCLRNASENTLPVSPDSRNILVVE